VPVAPSEKMHCPALLCGKNPEKSRCGMCLQPKKKGRGTDKDNMTRIRVFEPEGGSNEGVILDQGGRGEKKTKRFASTLPGFSSEKEKRIGKASWRG